jgi:hypothetical protein
LGALQWLRYGDDPLDVFADIPVTMAKASASGISLEGAGEGLSLGAAGLFLRSPGGNPMDVH